MRCDVILGIWAGGLGGWEGWVGLGWDGCRMLIDGGYLVLVNCNDLLYEMSDISFCLLRSSEISRTSPRVNVGAQAEVLR